MDSADLERQYLSLCREVHPDYFQSSGTIEQRASLGLAAGLNESYTILRDPFHRAEYLLQLEGGPTAAELKEMSKAFLQEMLELRMDIEDIKSSPESPEFLAMAKKLAQRRENLLTQVSLRFGRLTEDPSRDQLLKEVRQLLNATKYVQGLIRDLHGD